MSINLLTGQVGTGKSFGAVMVLIIPYLRAGLNVYTNIKLNVDILPHALRMHYHYVTSRNEILSLRSGIIVLDEGQIWFNARNFANMPEELQWKFQQHRHDDLHLWIITQNAKRVDIVIRELVTRYARTRLLWQFRNPFRNNATNNYTLQSPLIPSMGIGIQADPDYARFALDFYDMDDLTNDFRPRKDCEPITTIKYMLKPSRKRIFDTRHSQVGGGSGVARANQSQRSIPLTVRHETPIVASSP